MNSTFSFLLKEQSQKGFLASRTTAAVLRQEIERQLVAHHPIEIDFTGVNVTQSFTDELIGVIAYKHGPAILKQIAFKGCSQEHKKIIQFVVSHRLSTRVDLPRAMSTTPGYASAISIAA